MECTVENYIARKVSIAQVAKQTTDLTEYVKVDRLDLCKLYKTAVLQFRADVPYMFNCLGKVQLDYLCQLFLDYIELGQYINIFNAEFLNEIIPRLSPEGVIKLLDFLESQLQQEQFKYIYLLGYCSYDNIKSRPILFSFCATLGNLAIAAGL